MARRLAKELRREDIVSYRWSAGSDGARSLLGAAALLARKLLIEALVRLLRCGKIVFAEAGIGRALVTVERSVTIVLIALAR